jgi:hypothetical protein
MADLYAALESGLPLGEAATYSPGRARFSRSNRKPAPPNRVFLTDVGFIGRDETILKLDRTFDEQNIVLLHAYARSGKTSAAAQFARWYGSSGGLPGKLLFTSFEQHEPLPRVLDELDSRRAKHICAFTPALRLGKFAQNFKSLISRHDFLRR